MARRKTGARDELNLRRAQTFSKKVRVSTWEEG
jgi:hypothetical protein